MAGSEIQAEDVEVIRGWVERARSGDRAALAAIFERYYDGVYRYALMRTGSVADAEDAASETFTRVVTGVRRFRWGDATFGSWVFGIARNVVADGFRSRARRPEHLTGAVPDGADGGSPEDDVLATADAAAVRAAMTVLTEDQRQCLLLKFAGGLSSQEIGDVLGKSAGAVRIMQMRALEALREEMSA